MMCDATSLNQRNRRGEREFPTLHNCKNKGGRIGARPFALSRSSVASLKRQKSSSYSFVDPLLYFFNDPDNSAGRQANSPRKAAGCRQTIEVRSTVWNVSFIT